MFSGIYNLIKGIRDYFFGAPEAAPEAPAQQALPAGNSHAAIAVGLAAQEANANPPPPRPWYYLSAKETTALIENAKRDFIWPILTTLTFDCAFKKTNNFWAQAAGQQLWSSVGVVLTGPLTAAFSSWFYGETFKNCMIYVAIADASCLYTIIPWDAFAFLGIKFFKHLGYDDTTAAYLASIFPGPGTAEGTMQTLATTGLSQLFDPNFKFDGAAFGLGLTPIAYMAGDSWQASFNAMAHVASASKGGLIAQGFVVAATVMTMNYVTLKLIGALSQQIHNCCCTAPAPAPAAAPEVNRNDIEAIERSGSPVHSQPMRELHHQARPVSPGISHAV